jgi:hypothetical protein
MPLYRSHYFSEERNQHIHSTGAFSYITGTNENLNIKKGPTIEIKGAKDAVIEEVKDVLNQIGQNSNGRNRIDDRNRIHGQNRKNSPNL